MFELNIFN